MIPVIVLHQLFNQPFMNRDILYTEKILYQPDIRAITDNSSALNICFSFPLFVLPPGHTVHTFPPVAVCPDTSGTFPLKRNIHCGKTDLSERMADALLNQPSPVP